MTSIFSFLSEPSDPDDEDVTINAQPAILALPETSAAVQAATLTTGQPSPAYLLTHMVNILRTFLLPSYMNRTGINTDCTDCFCF
jgi:hypothetical protein